MTTSPTDRRTSTPTGATSGATTRRTTAAPTGHPNPFGSILDVSGIGVGHHQRLGRGWQTGTTVVTVAGGATPGVDVRGGGPGTRETDALRPENLVSEIHAVCLSGGSAFGLAAADGVMAELETRGLGVPVGDAQVVPVVPTAVIFDLGRGGNTANRPDSGFGRRACVAALSSVSSRRRIAWGSVGAGAGARSGGLQGGVGTASVDVTVTAPHPPQAVADAQPADAHRADDGATDDDAANGDATPSVSFTVGALAVVNSHGSVIDPATGLPWERPGRGWPQLTASTRGRLRAAREAALAGTLNTTIGVVATDLDLDKAACTSVASVAHDGLARAVRPAHALVDGDTVFTLSTGGVAWLPDLRVPLMNALTAAAADAFAAACTHAVIAATTVGGAPAWSDVVS